MRYDPANATAEWSLMTWMQTITMASHWVGLTSPGMIELPGSLAGSFSAAAPARGLEASQRMSLAIFIRLTARPRRVAAAATMPSRPPWASNLWVLCAADYGCLVSQWDVEAVKALRSAVYNGDGSVVRVVRGRLTEDVLQLAGDGLLDAVAQDAEGAVELAAQCAAALRERCWDGDEDLADQLQAAVGQGPTPLLRSLPVDLEELASLLEGDPLCGGGRIDLRSGDCWPQSMECEEDDGDEDDEDRWLYVAHEGSREGYRDMGLFIATMEDPAIADRLQIAITGKGAFRRFKDVLSGWPQELQRYYQLSNERQRGRARAWLAAEGFRPAGAVKPRP